MAFRSAQSARILASAYSISAVAAKAQVDYKIDPLDVTVIGSSAKAFIAGRESSMLSINGYLDTDATALALNDQLTTWKANSKPVTWAPEGTTAGNVVELMNAIEVGYTTSAKDSGVVGFTLSGQTDGFSDFGIALTDLTAVTTNGSTTGIDNAAATSNGGVAHIHVTAFSGLTSDAIIIEHSTNNSTWATLVTFTTVTALTSERIVVAAGTTVNRYLRVTDTVVGSGSTTRQVSFARR